ncbi:MAG: FtsX-like permease family protein [bacterium]
MFLFKIAYRNLVGAGLRTWLNVGVLSLIYVLIIWHQGLFIGMLKQASRDAIRDEISGGQYWQKNYDPDDPMSLDDSHAPVPPPLKEIIRRGDAVAVLVRNASIFPGGRIQNILLKGIEPGQNILGIPTALLATGDKTLPVLAGERMARNNSLRPGGSLTIRWRDVHGTFDAEEGRIAGIIRTNVASIDSGQLWVPLPDLQKMMVIPGEATMVVIKDGVAGPGEVSGWVFRDQNFLLRDIHELVRSKRSSSILLYLLLLFLALLAIFDTQVLAIFRRRREIGTLMAMGMTRLRVILIFTIEGMMNALLALAVGAVYGIPLLFITARTGIPLPQDYDRFGFDIGNRILPAYSAGLVLGTVLLVTLTVTIVSYLPARDISRLKPTDALRGKVS